MAENPATPAANSSEKPQYVTSTGAAHIDDKSVRIPAAVRRSTQSAEDLHAQYYPKQGADLPQGGNPEAPGQSPAGRTGSPPPAANNQVADSQPVPPGGQHAGPGTEAPANWEHKFNSVNGRYQKATQTITNLTGQLAELEAALADRDARLVAASTQAPPQPMQTQLTPQEIEDYGEEFLDVVGKKAREIAAAEIASLKSEISQLKNDQNQVRQNTQRSARETMKSELDASIPNWRQINDAAEFMAWLGLKDPYSGHIRLNMLRHAWDANDTFRVKAFFNGFITDEAVAAPHGNEPAFTPQNGENKVPLERFAAPGRASNSGDSQSPGTSKPIITRAQISAFHRDVAAGKYRGREAEAKAFDIAMIEAAREGRVQ